MRCDLHVHTRYSGPVDLPGLRHLTGECYSQPRDVYRQAKTRGMDLVTITDHDTVEGALQLAHLPDFIVGEEVTCEMGPGREIHLGIWDLDEKRHIQIQARRRDPEALFAWIAENRLPACINHPFSPLTGKRHAEDFHRAFRGLALIEAQNGMMPEATNEFAHAVGRAEGLAPVGGSDAHTLDGVARAFTTVPKATDRREFLDGLRNGLTVPVGNSGSYQRLTAAVFRVFGGALEQSTAEAFDKVENLGRAAVLLSMVSLLPLVPLAALVSYVHEWWGGRCNHSAYQASKPEGAPRPRSFAGRRLAMESRP